MIILLVSTEIIAQKIELKLFSIHQEENIFLSKVDFKNKHSDSISIYNEIAKISKYLKLNGYFLNTLDSIVKNDKQHTAYFSLNEKLDTIVLSKTNLPKVILDQIFYHKKKLTIPISKLEATLNEISDVLEKEGSSFSKVALKNFTIDKKTLFADIVILKSKKRNINKVIVKGYKDFPNAFIKNYFNINNETTFNRTKLKEISALSKGLDFASEIKPPETLFTKDSTFIYMYLKKEKINSFDGLINFTTQDSGKLLFTGYLDLKLKNLFKTGESLNLLWNSIGNERQELKLSTKLPYLFNTKVSSEINFSIYKQDSTFLNTKLNSKIQYQIKNNSNLFLSFVSENSEELENTTTNNIDTFSSIFIGLGYQYKLLKNDFFNNNKFFLEINPSFGKRKNSNASFNQIKLESTISYLFDLNSRNTIFTRNKTGLLSSENYIDNELFRIGGNNSIRGFNEQSIFVKNYVLQNIEYRYKTSSKSFLYSITDLALVSTSKQEEKLFALGIGYLFNTNNSQINITTSVGTSSKTSLNFNNIQFFVNWVNYF
ncbi:hypothetical protein [uncultured Polaribacter sp.]|uniref:ShlB/FhaC/HecB family hemolysin secretion/activation protein n=1 Tax=uncultured Polaribacter sp. TaxID=174711 RepID=UPI002620E52D|nr:hypothetical protein [uncultured Polaribacter sp.]